MDVTFMVYSSSKYKVTKYKIAYNIERDKKN